MAAGFYCIAALHNTVPKFAALDGRPDTREDRGRNKDTIAYSPLSIQEAHMYRLLRIALVLVAIAALLVQTGCLSGGGGS